MSNIKRRMLPERKGITHKVCIGGQNVYFRTGEFDDGTLGEIFITIDREGGELRVYDAVAVAVSIGLQHGVPLGEYIDKLEHHQFEPSGVTSNDRIPLAKSIIDYMAKWLKGKY